VGPARNRGPRTRDEVRLEIDGLGHDGKGIGRIDGKVAFVAGALPGETVDAVLRQRHRRYDEYRLIDVVTAAPDRTAPRCPLVGKCGGCDLQHLAADAQLRHKTDVVLELLRRQARLVPDQLVPPLRSAPFGYRSRARLAASVPRRGGRPRLGFREAGGNRVLTLDSCPVLAPPLRSLPALLQEALDALDRPADLGHVELSLAESPDGTLDPVIHLHLVVPLTEHDLAVLGAVAVSRGAYLSLRLRGHELAYLHRPRAEAPAYLLPEFDLRIGYEPGDFLQGNAAVNRRLVGRVAEWLDDRRGGRLLDAFAGVGNFSLALARRGFDVLGLEVVGEMVTRARSNALANGAHKASFAVRDLQGTPRPLGREAFGAAVLDPPRSGAHALALELAALGTPIILYVSCWPPTLARDAAVLAAAGYRLARLSLVDMFPQTSHIEVLTLFTRPRAQGRRGGSTSAADTR